MEKDKLNSLSSYDLFLTHLSSIATSPRKIQRACIIFLSIPFSSYLFLLLFFFLNLSVNNVLLILLILDVTRKVKKKAKQHGRKFFITLSHSFSWCSGCFVCVIVPWNSLMLNSWVFWGVKSIVVQHRS